MVIYLLISYVPVRVIRDLGSRQYTFASYRCGTSQYRTFIALAFSQCNSNYFGDPMFDGVGLAGFTSRTNALLLTKDARSLFVFTLQLFSLSLLSFNGLVLRD